MGVPGEERDQDPGPIHPGGSAVQPPAGAKPGSRPGFVAPAGGWIHRLYADPVFLALLPPVALTFDYSMTFFLAGGHGTVLASEASPVIRFALAYHLMVAWFLALLVTYFLVTLGILRFLSGTPYYRFGVLFVILISAAHLCGGLTWVFRNDLFSMAVTLLFMASFVITLALVLWTTAFALPARSPGRRPR